MTRRAPQEGIVTQSARSGTSDGPDMLGLIADEMDLARDALEGVVAVLCADREIVDRHLSVLQAIDEISQRHENLARLLRSTRMDEDLASISLDSLRARLLAARGTARQD